MLAGCLALLIAGLFTGAACYINFAEQPARLRLDDGALLAEWKFAYKRGFAMQATLAFLGFLLGMLAWYLRSKVEFAIGAVLLVANWPWTMLVMMPVNKKLMKTPPENAGRETRALLLKWNRLHAARTILGSLSALAYIFGLAWK
ncbi:MAG TPA: DUF1772 domain-containing protein [Candidatus Acidoferrum sp.]